MKRASGIRQSLPDLARLPLSLDIRAVNVAEGMRAAFTVALLVVASTWLHLPGLIESALAALFACLSDVGGPIRRRVPALLIYSLLGAVLVTSGVLVREINLWLALPFGVALIFCSAFARVYGLQAQQIGMFLCVMLVLSFDRTSTNPMGATVIGGFFLFGGLWAALMTMVVWRLHPFQPVRSALSRAYAVLSDMARDLHHLLGQATVDVTAWEMHARAQRSIVRAAIEAARGVILGTIRTRGPVGERAAASLLRLETADQLFGAMIALEELLETASADERVTARHMTRRLRPLLTVIGHDMATSQPLFHPQVARSIEFMSRDIAVLPQGHPLRELAEFIIARLRILLTMQVTADSPIDAGPGEQAPRRWKAFITPILANLNWRSMAYRHALRAAALAAPALAFSLIHQGPFDHWVSITVLVTMQPYFGSTFLRVLERTAGTMLGGLIAVAIGLAIDSPLGIALAMFPLAIAVFSLRQVSVGLFISGMTSMIVLLIELGLPGSASWVIAGERLVMTAAGGLMAVAGCYLLWPSFEPNRLRGVVMAAIAAHSRYAQAELSLLVGEATLASVDQARRAAGLASNNVEAAVARALLEPGSGSNAQLEAAMVVDAALRRLAGRIAAMQYDPGQAAALSSQEWRAWRDWIAAEMAGLVAGTPLRADPPALLETEHTEALGRIARQIELIEGTIAKVGVA